MKQTFIELIFIIPLLFLSSLIFAQETEFRRLDSPEGGAFGFITGITQDKDGNMWISSKGGLLKHNGTRITTYQHNPLNTNSVSTNNLETVFPDKDGSIWVGTLGNGLDRLNPKTGVFEHFRHNPDNPASISNDTITAILRDSSGDLLIGTHQGLNRYDEETGQFIHFKHDQSNSSSISNNQVRVIYEDKQANLWIGTGSPYVDNGGGPEDGGLNLFDKESGTFKRYLHDPSEETSLLNNKISSIYEDRNEVLWIGTAHVGMHKMDRENGTFERCVFDPLNPDNLGVPLDGNGIADYEHITFVTEDSAGDFWYGTVEKGVYHYDVSESRIIKHLSASFQPGTFEGSGAWAAYTSREGILWLGAIFPGNIFTVNPNSIKIEHHSSELSIQGFYHSANRDLYLATERGFQIIKANGDTIHQTLKNPESELGNWVSQFKEDSNSRLWVAGFNGLNYWDKQKNDWVSFNLNPDDGVAAQGRATSILFDRNDNFWVGTIHGLCKISPETGEVSRIFIRQRDVLNVGMNVISCLLEGDQNRLWVGIFNGGGLHLFDPETNSAEPYLKSMDLLDLYRDQSGIVWAGTSNGLYWYDEKRDGFVRFVNPFLINGVPDVTSIVEDNYRNLWVSSSIGLVQINPERDQISVYDREQGIESYNFEWDSGYKDENGHIYFGNDLGYYTIDPTLLKEELKSPEISLTGFRLANEYVLPSKNGVLKENLSEAKEIDLEFNQNVFSFDFATIDFTDPDRNRMIYYLENYDNNWSLANSENRAYYFNVPPGKYTFYVKASKGYGPWATKKIDLIIAPPWWKTWWAYSGYAIVLGLFIFAFDRFMRQRLIRIERERSREKELQQAKEIEKAYKELKNTQAQLIQSEKMASLGELTAGIAHEIQNPLNFVNNFSDLSQELLTEMTEELEKGEMEEVKELSGNIEKNLEKISHHGKRASDIVKGMLQHSRAGGISKEITDLNKLADEYFRLAYHGLRAKDKSFSAKMETDYDKNLEKVDVIPQDIGRVLLNIITNAFHVVSEKKKESPEEYQPTVALSTINMKDRIEVKISDNGNGIPNNVLDKIFQPFFTTKPSGQGTGLGLSLSYDIVKAHGGEILVETQEGEGSTFIIQLPKN